MSVPESAEAKIFYFFLAWISVEFFLGGALWEPHGIAHFYLFAERSKPASYDETRLS